MIWCECNKTTGKGVYTYMGISVCACSTCKNLCLHTDIGVYVLCVYVRML